MPGRMIKRAPLATLLVAFGLALAGVSSASAADGDMLFKQCVSANGSGGACTPGRMSLRVVPQIA